jgi:ATP-binding cassette subfamily C (CFTR/MRP) protein 1
MRYIYALLYYCPLLQGFSVGTNLWLSEWSDDPASAQPPVRNLYLSVYGALGTASALTICLSSVITAVGGLNASNLLHDNMLGGVLRAPMSFFDTTPKGRIVNRFAKDVDYVDRSIPMTFAGMLRLGNTVDFVGENFLVL